MRAVVQRVRAAAVLVGDETVGEIERGLLIYLGISASDTEAEASWMAAKLDGLRIFEDEREKMSLCLREVAGAALVVSQFTLYGDVRKGRRPSFDKAMAPEPANALYELVCASLRARNVPVAQGRFRATMQVHAQVDGPVTILIDSDRAF